MAHEYRYEPRHDTPLPPGEHIREFLDERGISQVDFATRLGKSTKFVSQLINGKVALTYDTAVELERVLGMPSSFWNNAEAIYRDALAWQRNHSELAEQKEWVKSFPMKQMEEHGWIAREESPAEKADALLKFFAVSSIDAYTNYWSSEQRLAARMTTAYTAETPALAAWIRAGQIEAAKVKTLPYDEKAFRALLAEIREMTRLQPSEWHYMLVDRCSQVGVAVVFVPDVPKTRCWAISRWDSKRRAVVQIGLRYKTDDHLWFSFFHEAAHLLLDDHRHTGINDLDSDPESEERANRFAADALIPPDDYAAFLAHGKSTKASVWAFASSIGIAPSIVVGRLQKDGVVPRSWMNDLKTKLEWA